MSPSSFVPSVSQTGGDGAFVQAPQVAPEKNFAPQQIEQMGQAVGQLGGAEFRTGQSMTRMVNDTIDDANVKAAETQMLTGAMDVTKGYLATEGKAAIDGYDSATQALSKVKQDAASGLTNPIQQRMYNQVAQQHLASLGAQMYDHNHRQTVAYGISSAKARAQSASLLALQASDDRYQTDADGNADGDFHTATGVMEQEAQNAARLSGFSGKDPVTGKMDPQTEAMVREQWTQLNHAIISKLLDNHDATGAQKWFNEQQAAGHMEATDVERLGSLIKTEKDNQYYEDQADKNYIPASIAKTATAPVTFAPIAPGAPINPTAPAVTDRPGTARPGGRVHDGYDIAMPVNTPLSTPAAGTVSRVWNDEQFGGGLSVEVALPDGRTVGMAHLSATSVKPGDTVQQGQVIGKSGQTGNATGPSVHYMLRNADGSVGDPFAASQPQPNPAGFADPQALQRALDMNNASSDDPYTKKRIMLYLFKRHSEERQIQDQTYEEDVKQPAVQAIYANGGNYSAIPANIRTQLKPEDAVKLQNFEMPIKNDMPTVAGFITNPASVTEQAVNDAFAQKKLTRETYTEFLQRAVNYKNAPDKILEASANANDVRVIASQNGYMVGPGSSADDDAKLAYLTYQVDHDILAKEQSTGKKLDQNAKDDIIKYNVARIATTNISGRGWYNPAGWGIFGGKTPGTWGSPISISAGEPQSRAQTRDISGLEKIPDEARAAIIDEAKRNGVTNPSEAAIRARYAQLQLPAQANP